jgi:hypothetical protein
MIRATFRPIDTWPGQLRTDADRQHSRFKAHHGDTLDLLQRELDMLDATDIIVQLALTETQIRNDGWPRSDARPSGPQVAVSFDSKHGPLQYATDVYRGTGDRQWGCVTGWQANLRAIALGLESLRRVDRYGITKSGEQYRGWKQLGAGGPIAMGAGSMTVEEAARFITEHSDDPVGRLEDLDRFGLDVGLARALYRDAAKRLHPDAGGDPAMFRRLQDAKAVLDGAAR